MGGRTLHPSLGWCGNRVRWRLREGSIGLAVAALALLVNCGGGGSSSGASEGTTPDDAPSTTLAPDNSGTGGSGSSTIGASGDTSGGATGDEAAGSPTTFPATLPTVVKNTIEIKVTLAESCLRPGGKQSITIDMGRKGVAAYQAIYSDGNNALDPDFYGGNAGDETDTEGRYADTWVVSPAAPPGRVLVNVIVTDGHGGEAEEFRTFHLAGPDGKCATD